MARSYSRIGMTLFTALFLALFITGAASMVDAQSFGDDWIEDDNLHILLLFDGRSAASATTEGDAIIIPREGPMELYLEINVTNDAPLNMSGVITFYYQGVAVLPIEIQNPITGTAWVPVDPDIGVLPLLRLPRRPTPMDRAKTPSLARGQRFTVMQVTHCCRYGKSAAPGR